MECAISPYIEELYTGWNLTNRCESKKAHQNKLLTIKHARTSLRHISASITAAFKIPKSVKKPN